MPITTRSTAVLPAAPVELPSEYAVDNLPVILTDPSSSMRLSRGSGPRWWWRCHLLTHEDQGMMGQFVVVEPRQHPSF